MTLKTGGFRMAVSQDLPVLLSILVAAFTPYARKLGRNLDAGNYKGLEDRIEAGEVYCLEGGDGIEGVLLIYREGSIQQIDQIAVAPIRQGKGVGRLLMLEAERLALADGAGLMRLDTAEMMTDLVRFYSGLGYEIYKTGLPVHRKDNHMRLFMEKTLSSGPTKPE